MITVYNMIGPVAIEHGGGGGGWLRFNFSDVGGPTMVFDVKENF